MNGTWMRAATLALLVTLPSRAWAQQQPGSIVGRITVRGADQPLSDVQVLVAGTAARTRTNEDGRFRLPSVAAGSVVLRVVRLGYAAQSRTITVTGGESATADFALAP